MFWEIAAATIEDLASEVRSSREPDGVGRRGCLSGASSAAAEKSERRMALKIRLGARLFPKTSVSNLAYTITNLGMLPGYIPNKETRKAIPKPTRIMIVIQEMML
jgi:hypothetical protein